MAIKLTIKDDISVVLCGAAGQGVQTVEQLLTHLFKESGYCLYATKEYMSRVRGGSNSTEIRVASHPVDAYLDRIDILFPLNRDALLHVAHRISPETVVLGEKSVLIAEEDTENYSIIDIPFSAIAGEIGGAIYSNIIATGVLASLFSLEQEKVNDYLKKRFGKKGDAVVAKNIEAVGRGFEIGKNIHQSGVLSISLSTRSETKDEIIINGGEAVGLGALAGGCNFISSYPMTPSTPVLTFLAQHGNEFGVIAEQAEDEIAAINMAVGAWYAGARAMVTTSGGGFALMTEGVSLAGIIESPMVIHLAQRPGPATGLPTQTEQGDLDLALYAGHGEFPRIIFAPGTLEDGFTLMRMSFNLAAKYQVPVFVLTDQYFIDSYYTTPSLDLSGISVDQHIVKTEKDYRRYKLTADGISPRGIPGYGDGLVLVDSDEHDEEGHLTESHDIRVAMMNKRLGKLSLIIQDALKPERIGSPDAGTIVVCWGSTFTIAREAVSAINSRDVALLYFKQVFPLPADIGAYFSKAKKIVIVEGNAGSQFSRVLKQYADIDTPLKITKYNGLQYSVEELTNRLKELIET